jgi:hypothetical protein
VFGQGETGALSEEQIVRYSRQILLATVGGVGQARLLSGRVALSGGGVALSTAAAYLASGGTPVVSPSRPLPPGEVAFWVSAADSGADAATVLRGALEKMNPEVALRATPGGPSAWVGELPARFQEDGPWVALTSRGELGRIVYRSALGCPRCFGATCEVSGGPAPVGLEVLVGVLGALAYQRIALGLSEPLGVIEVDPFGAVASVPPTLCEEHA